MRVNPTVNKDSLTTRLSEQSILDSTGSQKKLQLYDEGKFHTGYTAVHYRMKGIAEIISLSPTPKDNLPEKLK